MITTILFDLDGTLLPMDLDLFMKEYMRTLTAKVAPLGFDTQKLISVILRGTKAMMANDGSQTNEDLLWDMFVAEFGEDARTTDSVFMDYYHNEFQEIRNVCGFDSAAAACIHEIKKMGFRVALATNPLFPAIATQSRIRWIGLEPEDFELVTTYENYSHCKPNPAYFQDVLHALGVTAQECIMVGNDTVEDMAADKLGIPVFFLTHSLLNKNDLDLSQHPHGDFADLMDYIRGLNK